MNKAFVKEPEDHGEQCPPYGSMGIPVSQRTVLGMHAEISETGGFIEPVNQEMSLAFTHRGHRERGFWQQVFHVK